MSNTSSNADGYRIDIDPRDCRLGRRTNGRLSRAALAHDPDRPLRRSGDGNGDAEAQALDIDLQPTNPLAQRRDASVERPDLFAGSRPGHRLGPTRATTRSLPLEVLLGDTLNDLATLLLPVEELGLQVDEPNAQVRELVHRGELFSSVR
jgi:hypothetical protein